MNARAWRTIALARDQLIDLGLFKSASGRGVWLILMLTLSFIRPDAGTPSLPWARLIQRETTNEKKSIHSCAPMHLAGRYLSARSNQLEDIQEHCLRVLNPNACKSAAATVEG